MPNMHVHGANNVVTCLFDLRNGSLEIFLVRLSLVRLSLDLHYRSANFSEDIINILGITVRIAKRTNNRIYTDR